ncbi:tetratricopeptide repeat protein [Pseudovibrio sp. Tun.PSC04-5.I4]|uniref:tetratricopeptide repeat protein n=1 Tax=Pseudovibrio sp. Tun.PSC04-5.I4 TaxID=1798213 RepID=UPI00088B51BF|nr:tetratricopeptide repeat protein [Pseudovibrio sp. Tun.PSC04-5.I4]SDQ94531.1 Tetratricopeptide repeat-containing protein [Pseudovibrio sp. Tun.PSC04-5.I4]
MTETLRGMPGTETRQERINAALDAISFMEQEERFEEVIPVYQDLVGRYPDDVELLFRMATIMLRNGDLREAVAHLRKVLFMKPEHLPARANMGNALLLLGYLEQSREAFEAVVEAEPQNRNALYGLATILIKMHVHLEAEPYARRLVKQIPTSAPALTLLADALSADTKAEAAVLNYLSALKADSSYVPALVGLAKVLIQRKKAEEAHNYLNRAHDLQPRNVDVLVAMGHAYFLEDNVNGAVESFELAHACEPDNAAALLHLSIGKRRMGLIYAGVLHAAEAWRLAPGNKQVGNALGAALASAGANDAARDVLTSISRREDLRAATTASIKEIEYLANQGYERPQPNGQEHLSEPAMELAVDTTYSGADDATDQQPSSAEDAPSQRVAETVSPDYQDIIEESEERS